MARLDLMTSAQPEVPRKFRNTFVDRRAARAALQRILARPAQRVLMAHAAPGGRRRPGLHPSRLSLAGAATPDLKSWSATLQ